MVWMYEEKTFQLLGHYFITDTRSPVYKKKYLLLNENIFTLQRSAECGR